VWPRSECAGKVCIKGLNRPRPIQQIPLVRNTRVDDQSKSHAAENLSEAGLFCRERLGYRRRIGCRRTGFLEVKHTPDNPVENVVCGKFPCDSIKQNKGASGKNGRSSRYRCQKSSHLMQSFQDLDRAPERRGGGIDGGAAELGLLGMPAVKPTQ